MKHSILFLSAFAAIAAHATLFRVSCDQPDAKYRLGEIATFTVEATEKNGAAPKGMAHVRLDNFGDRIFMERDVDLAKEAQFTVTGQMDRAGFLMLRVSKKGSATKLFGVGYEPEKLRPYRECPADFDQFWSDAIKKYDAEVTAPIKMTKVDPGNIKERDLYELEIPAVGNRTVWGYLSVPTDASKRPYPLVVRVPGAGPASFFSGGSANTIDLFVNVHYYKPVRGLKHKCPEHLALQKVEDEAYAKKYPVKVVRYTQCGIAVSREDYFYYGIILAANRAIDWACARPDVDKARVRYTGGSQGGGFGLILTGLNKHIRRAVVTVPAITDHLCFKIDGREAGWPRLIDAQLDENRAAAEANAPYFDAVYFAQRIDVPIRMNVGFADTVCPPHAGYTAYNVCPSKDKLMRYGIGQGHPPQKDIVREFAKWLERDSPADLAPPPAPAKDAVKTPAQSKLFDRHVDPRSGVVSYILKPGLLMFNQQSFYFTSKSMTDDGRFILLDVAPDEKAVPGTSTGSRVKALVDLVKDEAFILDKTNGQIPWLDVERDQLWWLNAEGVHRRDLLVDPQKDIIVCPCPPELTYPDRPSSIRYGTHVTLSPDRKLMFVDGKAGDIEKEGVLNLETGKWEEWGRANFCCNHGQYNPVDPTMAMCAMEYSWMMSKDELTPEEVAKAGMEAGPFMTKVRRPRDDIYPRLWLFRKGEFWMVPSKITNSATHEYFAEDGKGFYWCSGGTCYHDLATDRQWRINPCSAAHCSMSADNRYIVFDSQWGRWYRGCGWTVGFWNRETHRGVYIHSKTPKIATFEKQSRMHPDPHPQIVCKGKYAICTMNDYEGRMNLSVTPMDQLIAITSDPANAPAPKRFEVAAWKPDLPLDAPFELEIDVKALRDRHLVDEPGCRVHADSYTPFALEAEGANGKRRPVPFEAVQSPAYATRVILRFNPPKDALKLFYVADAPGRFEYRDSELCANLFDRRIPHDLFPPKAARTAKPGERTPMAVCAVPPDAAGRPVKFELGVRNLARQDWHGNIRVELYDADGKLVGDAVGGRLENKGLSARKARRFNEVGSLAKTAREARLVVEGANADGSPAQVQLQHLNLRVARVLPFTPPK
jgi:cephalosporin-C deacetylase-like acetyl esterase